MIDRLLAAHDDAEDFPSDVSLQCPDCVELGMSRGNTAGDILFGFLVGPETANCNNMKGAIGKSVTTPLQSMSDGLA